MPQTKLEENGYCMQLALSATDRPSKLGFYPSGDKESSLKGIKNKTFTGIFGKLIWYWYGWAKTVSGLLPYSCLCMNMNEYA